MSIFAITGTILFRVRFMHVQVNHVHCMLQSPFTWMYMYVHICMYLLVIMQNIGNYVHVSICVYILAGKFFLLHWSKPVNWERVQVRGSVVLMTIYTHVYFSLQGTLFHISNWGSLLPRSTCVCASINLLYILSILYTIYSGPSASQEAVVETWAQLWQLWPVLPHTIYHAYRRRMARVSITSSTSMKNIFQKCKGM